MSGITGHHSAIKLLLSFTTALLLSACGSGNSSNAPLTEMTSATAQYWQLQRGTQRGKSFNATSASITLTFDDGRLFGHSGINYYSVPVSVSDGKITLQGPIITTLMAGPAVAMQLENNYLSTLRAVTDYQREDNDLRLLGNDGVELRFRLTSSFDN